MKTVKMGIIGIGNMGTAHANNILKGNVKNVELAAVCDIAPARRQWAKEHLSGVKVFDNATDLYKSGIVDAVAICTPHYDHPPLAIEAFECGLNVFIEKPAGVYTKQVLEMNEAAKKSGKVFGIGFNQRTLPVYNKLRSLVQSGELGHIKKIIWIVTNWYRPQAYHDSCSWRSTWEGEGGGTITNQNPHNLDLWQWIFGMPHQLISFNDYGKYYNIEVEDDVTFFVKYKTGTVGIYTTSTGEAPGTNRLEISCDMGKIVCEDGKLTFWRNTESEREFNTRFDGVFGSPECWKCEIPLAPAPESQHSVLMTNFANAVLTGAPLIAPGLDGIHEMTLANAIYYSDWLGNKWIDLENFDHEGFYQALQEKIKNSTFKKKAVAQKTASTEGTY